MAPLNVAKPAPEQIGNGLRELSSLGGGDKSQNTKAASKNQANGALPHQRRGARATGRDNFADLISFARAVPIEAEVARRGIVLKGGVDRYGPCPTCGGVEARARPPGGDYYRPS
jgi:hypothetical protein